MGRLAGNICRTVIALCGLAVLAVPALTQNRQVAALAKLEKGLWQLRGLDGAGTPYPAICIADPNMLMQIQHRNSPCSRLVISQDTRHAVVHYTCPAGGFGRTELRFETPRLAKIDTQGIVDNTPFAYRVEARNVGPCPGSRASR